MGTSNANTALVRFGTLKHREMRLLLGMALKALDSQTVDRAGRTREPRRYFDGLTAMCEILGAEPGSRSNRSSVMAALKALREAGAIEIVAPGFLGHQAEYALNLDPWTDWREVSGPPAMGPSHDTQDEADTRVDPWDMGPSHDTQMGPSYDTNGSELRDRWVRATTPLGEHSQQESSTGRKSSPSVPSPGAVVALEAVRAARGR